MEHESACCAAKMPPRMYPPALVLVGIWGHIYICIETEELMDNWPGSGTTLEPRNWLTGLKEPLKPKRAPWGKQDDVQWVLNTAHGCGFGGSIGHRLGLHGSDKVPALWPKGWHGSPSNLKRYRE